MGFRNGDGSAAQGQSAGKAVGLTPLHFAKTNRGRNLREDTRVVFFSCSPEL